MSRALSRPYLLHAAAACGILALAGCEFGETAVAAREPQPVVHAVLNPFPLGDDFTVLLERTLTGRVETRTDLWDPDDPVVTGGGDPITQARVQLCSVFETNTVCTATGIEDVTVREDGKGRGVYRFVNETCAFSCPPNYIVLRRTARYALRVTLPGGETLPGGGLVQAETTIPNPILNPDTALATRLDRDRDSVQLTWPAALLTHRYVVQIQTPYGPFQLFSATNATTVQGTLVNFQQDRLPRVFTPGFRHDFQIAAVDSSYFDYYRTRNDPFTGVGQVNRIRGGTGLFGSYVPIRSSAFEVVAAMDQPHEGTFTGDGERWMLYDNGPGLVSGRLDDAVGDRHGVLGTRDGARMRLAVLRRQLVIDTLYTVEAEVVGDELVLQGGPGGGGVRQRLPQ